MEEQYKSLFDFLGRPAGPELGKQVASAAVEQKIKMQEMQVSTKNYTGKIITYPVSFLENYFNGTQPQQVNGKMLLLDHQLGDPGRDGSGDLPF